MKYGDNVTQKAECTWAPKANEPEKLYYEAQKYNRSRSPGIKIERQESQRSRLEGKRRRKARTFG
jgi:hypothetical protein